MNIIQIILLTLGTASAAVILALIGIRLSYDPYAKIKRYTVGDGKTLKVGLMGDTQLLYSEDCPSYNYTDHLVQAFTVLKEQKVEVIVFTGDVGDAGRPYAFQLFQRIFDMVYQGEEKPILNIIMGNHDHYYYKGYPSIPTYHQKEFEKALGEKAFSHKVINGFHFINWSSMDATPITCNINILWAKKEIEKAIKEDPTKPVFVQTHFAPYNTMYGSKNWGYWPITYLLKQYPQVVSFSGHSHFSLIDERSIWQDEFTAITTQAVAYIELEKGKENGSVPKDEFGSNQISKRNYMGLIMTVNDENVEIQRISFEKNKYYKEPWIIDLPMDRSTFRYTDKRAEERVPPRFEGETSIEYIKVIRDENVYKQLRFTQAIHEDFVHSYRIIFTKEGKSSEYLYFSDFFLLKEDRGKSLTIKLPDKINEGEYEVEIYAIESFGKESQPIKGTIFVE